MESLVVRPAFRVGKVSPLEVETKSGDQILSQMGEISDDGPGFPTARMAMKPQAVPPGAERGAAGDRVVVVDDDIQVPPSGSDDTRA